MSTGPDETAHPGRAFGSSESRPSRAGRRRLLLHLEARLEGPMFLLAVLWAWLFVKELVSGLAPWETVLGTAIWAGFIVEFALKFWLAPRKGAYVVDNWLTLVALLVPALRIFRALRILRLLRTARVASSLTVIRGLTSGRRLYGDLVEFQGPHPEPRMRVAMLVVASRGADIGLLARFGKTIAAMAGPQLEEATGLIWDFDMAAPNSLESDDPRRPSDFLDPASMRMAEGSYDMAIVLTDVALLSRRRRLVPGLASPVTRMAIMSLRAGLNPVGPEDGGEPAARGNGATLLLHLIGHLAGLNHAAGRGGGVMLPFAFRPGRHAPPPFSSFERARLARLASDLPEREMRGGNVLLALLFHMLMLFRHAGEAVHPLLRNRAILLPLRLPSLATAAVAPSFVLIFTAEIWDVGFGMTNGVAAFYAATSILFASFYLAWAQALFLPRRERRTVTEHLAVGNGVIYLSILLACIGLFLMVTALTLVIVHFVFPADLMETWPTLEQADITSADKLRLAVFIGTVGMTTGALAGGFESRTAIQHLALFGDEP